MSWSEVAPKVSECAHGPDACVADIEGWENPTEPINIRVHCRRCGGHIDVRLEDPSLLSWEEGW